MEETAHGAGNKVIIITGPESTAKTALSRALTQKYNGIFIPEYAREYIENLKRPYGYNDIEEIALKQKQSMDTCFEIDSRKPFVFDTFLIITKVWFQWIAGNYPSWIDDELYKTKDFLYLLCAPDIEWIPDNVREHGGEERTKLFKIYKEELEKAGLNYRIVSGSGNERIKNACTFAEYYLKDNEGD